MRVPKFEYLEPQTIEQACSLLAEHDGQARLLAGGTDLLVLMKLRVETPQYLINLKRIKGLDELSDSPQDGLRIGPLNTLRSLAESPLLREKYPVLAQSAGAVASPNIRNTATIGGNLCLDAKCWYYNQSEFFRAGRTPCFKRGGEQCYVVKGGKFCYALVAADTVAALIALDARAKVVSSQGERTIPVAEFFTGKGETVNVLTPREVVTEIQVPAQPAGTTSAFIKQAFRRSIDFAITSAAAVLTRDADGTCQSARIALTAVSNAPVKAVKAAELLKGKRIDEGLAAEAGQAAVSESRPISAIWTSVYHRRAVIGTLVKRAILQANA